MSPHALPKDEHNKYSIACMPADGIGPEVIGAAVEVLKTLSDASGLFSMEFEDYDWSSDTYKKTGKYIPEGGLDRLKQHDAILFGAVGAPGNQSPRDSHGNRHADMFAKTCLTTSRSGASALRYVSRCKCMRT